jgi:hypothetical protein
LIALDGGLGVLCFNAHFGTNHEEVAQPAAAYAELISRRTLTPSTI